MKIRLEPELFNIIIFLIILSVIFIYFLFIFHKEKSFNDWATFFKIFGLFGFLVLVMLIFSFRIIDIDITIGSETGSESWIFTLINGFLIGMFINCIGITTKNNSTVMRYIFLFMMIYLIFCGFGMLGVLITFNGLIESFLFYNQFQNNSAIAIYFVSFNILYFMILYIFSFLFDKEVD